MRLALGTILAILGPLAAGWFLLQTLWPESPRGLRTVIAPIIGAGLAGTAYFFGLALADSSAIGLAASEMLLIAVIASILARKKFPAENPAWPMVYREWPHWSLVLAFALTAAVAAAAFFFLLDYSRHGGWDAVAIWNLKARFIFRSETVPLLRIVDPSLADTQPDYPLFLPSLLARGWQYAGRDSTLIGMGIAAFFTAATVLITVTGLQSISTRSQALLTGCVLMGTPMLLHHGVSQYADIVMCCFMTTTVVLFCIHDSVRFSWRIPFLAGLVAGFAACTKNEGILFILVVAGTRVLMHLWKKNLVDGAEELAGYTAGALMGIASLIVFKTLHSPQNAIVGNVTWHLILERMRTGSYQLTILRNFVSKFLNFGEWWIYPVPLLLIHLAITWKSTSQQKTAAIWPALVLLGMMAGYYVVYLITPYDLQWHLDTSLPRLFLQIWPTVLILYSLLAAPRRVGPDSR